MNHLTHDTYAQALIANLTVARTENDYTTIARIAEADLYTTEDHLFSLEALSLLKAEGESYYRQHPLLADFARTHGATSAVGALDRLSISIANRYGNGHPWLDCGALKQVTRDLVALNHSDELEAHAAYLLGSGPEAAVQLAARR